MRALIIASVSPDTFISFVSTCSTNASTHCLAVSRSSSVGARRPSFRILSSKLPSWVAATVAKGFAASAILVPPSRVRLWQTYFRAEFVQLLIIVQYLLQHLLKLVIAVKAAAQIGKLAAQLNQLSKWLDLIHNILWLKVFHVRKAEFDSDFRIIVGKLVVDLKSQARLHLSQHLVEVIAINFDKLAILNGEQGLIGLPGKVGKYADHEWQFLLFDGSAGFYVISNLHARGTDPPDLLLKTLFRHVRTPREYDSKGPAR